jgi:hypothetical protein
MNKSDNLSLVQGPLTYPLILLVPKVGTSGPCAVYQGMWKVVIWKGK